MQRLMFLVTVCLGLVTQGVGQPPPGEKGPPQNQAPPRSERDKEAGESSSRDTRIDLSPPKNDAKDHPNSTAAVPDAEDDTSGGVQEFHPFDPHRALKDIEVGDFYFKRKNYRAALDRYREALYYKYDDAVAMFRLGVCQEKIGEGEEARKAYESYLRILPHGPFANEAHQGLERLKSLAPEPSAEKK